MILDRAKNAEAVHDVVRDEVGRGVARLAVVAVVVAFAGLCVLGERSGEFAVLAVAGDEVGDVVADHPPEPPALVSLVSGIFAYVGGCGDADLYVPRGTAR